MEDGAIALAIFFMGLTFLAFAGYDCFFGDSCIFII